MNIKTAFPSQYITHEDLQQQDVPVQIAGCRMEPLKQDNGPDKKKPVLYFVGHQRGLVLNQVNAMTIASLYGDETEAWRGRWITLYPTQCQFGARMVDCIRVRPFSRSPPTVRRHSPSSRSPICSVSSNPSTNRSNTPAQTVLRRHSSSPRNHRRPGTSRPFSVISNSSPSPAISRSSSENYQ